MWKEDFERDSKTPFSTLQLNSPCTLPQSMTNIYLLVYKRWKYHSDVLPSRIVFMYDITKGMVFGSIIEFKAWHSLSLFK